MAYINCKKCGCQMSDKSEACPMCGTPVNADVEEINKPSVEEQPKPENPIPNEQPMKAKEDAAPKEINASTTTPPPPITPSNKPAKKSNKTPIIIGVVAAVVVIGAIAAFLLLRNPKTNEFETQIMSEAPVETTEETVDPCLTTHDESSNEDANYGEFNDQLLVPDWVLGQWEYDKNEVIEFTPNNFIFTVNGKFVEEGTYDVDGDIIYLDGESDVCQIGYVMMREALYFEGGDNVPLKKLSGESVCTAKGLTKEYEWLLGEWKGVDFKGDLAIISRDGIVFNNAVRSALLDEMEPDRSELIKQPYEIKKTTYDFDNNDYMSIVVSGNSADFRDGEAAYFLDLKSKVIFYFYDFDQKITLKKVK